MKVLIAVASVVFSIIAFAEGPNEVFDVKSFLGYNFGDDISAAGEHGRFKLDPPFRIFERGQAYSSKMHRIYRIRLEKRVGDFSDDSYRAEMEKIKNLLENKYKVSFELVELKLTKGHWNMYRFENENVKINLGYSHGNDTVNALCVTIVSKRQEREDELEFQRRSKQFSIPDNQGADRL